MPLTIGQYADQYAADQERCTRELPKALAPRGHVYEHGRCRQCNVTEPQAVGLGQPSARGV